jgi:hypothetical protein
MRRSSVSELAKIGDLITCDLSTLLEKRAKTGGAEMISKTSMTAIAICLGILAAFSASAQSPVGSTFQDQGKIDAHHLRIYQMMKNMTQEMKRQVEFTEFP